MDENGVSIWKSGHRGRRGTWGREGHRSLEGDVGAAAVGWSLDLGSASYPTSKRHLSIDSFVKHCGCREVQCEREE